MDEVVPRLWIGDLPSALDVQGLKAKKIFSVVTAMRGKVTINATFKYQINIDDSADEDVLVHFLPSISFIQRELDRGRGVLVHCQAGISRSATIVTAYLMYSRKIDTTTALDMIKKVRPNVEPNEGFLHQLEIFYQASYKFTRRDKSIRMFYMERTTEEIMNGDGTLPSDNMFARRPCSPTDSTPNTPVIAPSRRIRCKMCRQELATREHMLDHGQLGPPTPALPSLTPASSRRASNANDQIAQHGPMSRRPSSSLNVSISRRPSNANAQPPRARKNSSSQDGRPAILSALGGRSLLESLSMSALELEDDGDDSGNEKAAHNSGRTRSSPSRRASLLSMDSIGRELSDALNAASAIAPASSVEPSGAEEPSRALPPVTEDKDSEGSSDIDHSSSQQLPQEMPKQTHVSSSSTHYASPADLAAQLNSHPKLAALRAPPSLAMTSISGPNSKQPVSPPILMNPKCSGYFVEPMKWMEPFLENGELAGKIVCPNARCGVKLGNYDWAGVRCNCNEWVTPGFCIHRSKVDEIIV
ncbi:hypothetical protein J3A83DRAFT_4085933 [Scleroderma citrinum]